MGDVLLGNNLKGIIKGFLIWRLLLFLPILVAPLVIKERSGYIYQGLGNHILSSWANFDGVHYLSIALNGYFNQAAFFPLFPVLIKMFSFGKQVFFSGFLLSNFAFIASLIFFYKLVRLDYDKYKTREIILFLLLFPTAFFFGAIYSESLFFLLLVLSFYFARKGNWLLAVVTGILLTATRLVGVFILPALIYEYIVQKKTLQGIYPLALIPSGLAAYAVFNFKKWGDWLYFVHAHGELSNGRSVTHLIFFGQTLFRYFKIFVSLSPAQYEFWIAVLEVLSFAAATYLLYLAWQNGVRLSYLIFSVLAFLVPASSGTFTGLPRYILILFPMFIAISFSNKFFKYSYLIISSLLTIVLVMFFSQGYFVA